jgi:hypothetical protein
VQDQRNPPWFLSRIGIIPATGVDFLYNFAASNRGLRLLAAIGAFTPVPGTGPKRNTNNLKADHPN